VRADHRHKGVGRRQWLKQLRGHELGVIRNVGPLWNENGTGFFSYTAEEREQLLIARDRYYAALSALMEQLH
jgi:hypothetical protein